VFTLEAALLIIALLTLSRVNIAQARALREHQALNL
jgi:hypothetical protein